MFIKLDMRRLNEYGRSSGWDVFIRLVGYELKLERCHVSQFDGNREFGPKAGGEPLLV